MEWKTDIDGYSRFRRVWSGRSALGVELTADDFTDLIFRQGEQLLIGSRRRNGLSLSYLVITRSYTGTKTSIRPQTVSANPSSCIKNLVLNCKS